MMLCCTATGILIHVDVYSVPLFEGMVFVQLQVDADRIESNAACRTQCQAVAVLLPANIHAPDFKPAVALTDLRDRHAIS